METISKISLKKEPSEFKKVQIRSAKDAYDYIKQFYADDIEIFESFFLLLLNQASQTTGYAKISQGGTAGTVIDIKIIAKYALDSLSPAVILAHNHPSGNANPSKADKEMTQKIIDALDLFNIKVMDHIILTKDDFYSFTNNHEINWDKT